MSQTSRSLRNLPRTQRANGFTIVELVVVIVVIGILAAITVVSYRGIQTNARITSITSDLASNAKKLDVKKVSNPNRHYPTTTPEILAVKLEFAKDPYKWILYCTDGTTYKIAARMLDADRWWVSGSEVTTGESTDPGFSGSSVTTCNNLGYPNPLYARWLLSNSGWSI